MSDEEPDGAPKTRPSDVFFFFGRDSPLCVRSRRESSEVHDLLEKRDEPGDRQ